MGEKGQIRDKYSNTGVRAAKENNDEFEKKLQAFKGINVESFGFISVSIE